MDHIDLFLNYNYKPISKKNCVENILLVWLVSIWICLIGDNKIQWAIVVGVLDIAAVVVSLFLMIKHKNTPTARHGCDCVLMFSLSFAFLLISYRLQTKESGENFLLLAFLLFLLLLCNAGVLLLTLDRIKKNKYAIQSKSSGYAWIPIAGSVLGIVFARLFLPDIQEDKVLLLTAVSAIFLSFVCSVGTVALLKLVLQNDKMKQKLSCAFQLEKGA